MFAKVISAGDANYRTVQFEWFLTNWCNYKCQYCSEADNMSNKFEAGKYKLVLSRLSTLNTYFTVEIIGGEPTFHPHLNEIVQALSDNPFCERIEIVTNLSRPVDFYKQLNIPKVYILASYHPEYHSETFVEKLTQIENRKVTVNLSDKSEHWENTESMINMLAESGINFAFNILTSTSSYITKYDTDFHARFEKYVTDNINNLQVEYKFEDESVEILNEKQIMQRDLNKFKGYKCTPIRYRVTHDGEIVNFCTGKLQPIMISERSLFKQETCPVENCRCDALFVFHKEKI